MFALRSAKVASALKKKVGLEKQADILDEGEDELVRARFQEIGPRMTIKMRWIRRGALGETGNERSEREKAEKAAGIVSEVAPDEALEGAEKDNGNDGEEEEAAAAAEAIGLTGDSLPSFDDFAAESASTSTSAPTSSSTVVAPVKKVRKVPRKRKLPYHALLRPPPSPSPEPGYIDSAPAPLPSIDGKIKETSLLSTVGKTWHAGKGEGGVREGAKRREWGWEVSSSVTPFAHLQSPVLARYFILLLADFSMLS
jgi:ribosome production factor 1